MWHRNKKMIRETFHTDSKINAFLFKKKTEMKIDFNFIEATFIDRPNRFLTRARLKGKIVESHLPDPGRLRELLIPGSKLLLKAESGDHRKTKYSTQAVYSDNVLISINTWLPNRFVEYLIHTKKLAYLKNHTLVRREVTVDNSRFDFHLRNKGDNLFLEVKSVTLVEEGIAKFPDAVTERGRRHVTHLGEMAEKGLKTMVLFVVQRPDADSFQPQWERDPKFGFALFEAVKKGLEVKVIKMGIEQYECKYLGEIPFYINPPEEQK
jgi:sugar fermentation stimulation protein A